MKIIEIDGVKYKLTPIQEESKPQTFQQVLESNPYGGVAYPAVAEHIIGLLKEWLPKEIKHKSGLHPVEVAWNDGYNAYRNQLRNKLK